MSDIYVGIRKETEDGTPESDLRQHVCPQCGNVDILTGDAELDKDGKPLLSFPQPTIRPWDIRPW